MDINSINGRLIRQAREKKGLTQEKLAEKLYCHKQAVSNWERGKNRPGEDIRNALEKELGIKLNYWEYINRGDCIKMKPLNEINDLDEMFRNVDSILQLVELDSTWSVTIRRILKMILVQAIGYNCYYINHFHREESFILDWSEVAFIIDELLNNSDQYPIPEETTFPFEYPDDLMKKKIEWMSYAIGGELFEDCDENGFHEGFPQQVGRFAEAHGYDLLKILPSKNCSLMAVIKASILSLSEAIQSMK